MTHKTRVHELAKKYNINNKEFIELIKDIGIEVSTHLAGLSPEDELKIESHFGKAENTSTEEKAEEQVTIEEKYELIEVEVAGKDGLKGGKQPIKTSTPVKQSTPANTDKKGHNKSHGGPNKNKPFIGKPKEEEAKVEEIKVIKVIGESMPLKEFAEKLNVNPSEIIKKLFLKGHMLNVNSDLPFDLIEETALEYDILVEKEELKEEDYGEKYHLELEDRDEDLLERPPVITIMGHVDHGKTSLLDAIRETSVVSGEAGGITQKIGAYQVEKSGKKITFIDTPGHEAFTEMRARGTKVTDIAILVVAADDGVMPQTVEAISHAKAANVPIIVAVNKIDKPEADPMRVRQELTEYDLLDVAWGGTTEFVEVSAKKRLNLDGLLDIILVSAELLELKANPKKRAKGVVIESRLDPKTGPVADILIQEGTLSVGDIFVVGGTHGRVRALMNDRGKKIKDATMSTPVELFGFNSVPEAGDMFYVVENERAAKKIVEDIESNRKRHDQQKKKHMTLDDLHNKLESDKLQEIKLIIKADTKGSVEALKDAVNKLSNEEVKVNVIHSSPGAVTEGDVKLAEASDAIIIGFAVRPTTKAMVEAEKEKVEIRTYNVIYHVTEELEKAIKGMLAPEYKEVYQGRAEIRQIFRISKVGNIAGCLVEDGKIRRDSKIRILRNGVIAYDGKLATLKRFANEASEVIAGQECGMQIDGYNDIKEGDLIEAYIMEEVKR